MKDRLVPFASDMGGWSGAPFRFNGRWCATDGAQLAYLPHDGLLDPDHNLPDGVASRINAVLADVEGATWLPVTENDRLALRAAMRSEDDKCDDCDGTGHCGTRECEVCGGGGCDDCEEEGFVIVTGVDDPCDGCDATGWFPRGVGMVCGVPVGASRLSLIVAAGVDHFAVVPARHTNKGDGLPRTQVALAWRAGDLRGLLMGVDLKMNGKPVRSDLQYPVPR